MKAIALLNPASGSVPADGADRVRAALETAGVRGADIIEFDRPDCEAQLKRLAAAKPDLFVVWGGDGTLRSALNLVGKATPNLLLLPGGTMNMLARSIHGEKTWEEVLASVLAAPKRITLSAGTVNVSETFYCAMLAGAPARLAEARESLRRGELVKAAAEARAAWETLGTLHLDARYRDSYTFERNSLPATSIIAVLVGPLAHDHPMEVAALAEPSTGAALNVVWSSFISQWRNAPGITIAPASSLTIDSDTGDIPAILDGETVEIGHHARIKYIEEAAQCLTAG